MLKKKVGVWTRKRNGKDQFFVHQGKEVLSGPWPTQESANEARKEWM